MQQKFQSIAFVSFTHQYYGENIFTGFSIQWHEETGRLLKNLGLLIKTITNGFYIASDQPENLASEDRTLLLKLYNKDAFLYNYTDFQGELSPSKEIVYFSCGHLGHDEGKLHVDEFVSMKDTATHLNQELIQLIQEELQDQDTQLIFEGVVLQSSDFTNVLLRDPDELIFEIKKNAQRKRYYKPSQRVASKPFGIVELNLALIYEAFKAKGSCANYLIHMKSRYTTWKYILSDKVFEKFPHLMVVDATAEGVKFRESSFDIQEGWSVRCFESERQLPFTLNSENRFHVMEPSRLGSTEGRVIIKNLPHARPEHLNMLDKDHEKTSYAHIFI
jgi:hypothetical protein